jgi:hypothetical protein
MPTQQVYFWAMIAVVGVSQWAADSMGTGQEKGGLTMQWKDNKLRDTIWGIAQSLFSTIQLGTGPVQWDLPINCTIIEISNLAPERLLWRRFTSDKAILNGQKCQPALVK